MAEESSKEVSKEESKNASKEAAPAKEEFDGTVKVSEAELAELRKAHQIYSGINERYKADPSFAEQFDNAWKSKKAEMDKSDAKKEAKGEEVDPIERLERENQELRKLINDINGKADKLETDLEFDKVAGARHSINVEYENEFINLAEQEGFDVGSAQYDVLFSKTKDEAMKLARKYGLVDQHGRPDPMAGFKPTMIKEAFKNAFETIKKMGYDVKEVKRQEIFRKKEEQKKRQENEFSHLLKKENLKTPQQRAKVLQEMWRTNLQKQGIDVDQFKIV